MKTINLIVSITAGIACIVSLINGDKTNGLLFLIIAKLYTDGSTKA